VESEDRAARDGDDVVITDIFGREVWVKAGYVAPALCCVLCGPGAPWAVGPADPTYNRVVCRVPRLGLAHPLRNPPSVVPARSEEHKAFQRRESDKRCLVSDTMRIEEERQEWERRCKEDLAKGALA
jgi:hypothetical protein